MLRSADQSCQERIAQCWWRRFKVLSHRQHSSSTLALRNSTGWTREQRQLVASTSMDHSCSLRLFQAWVKCRRWQSTGWERSEYMMCVNFTTNMQLTIGVMLTTDQRPTGRSFGKFQSATDRPIHFMFGLMTAFWGSADRMALFPFPVRINPSWSLPYTRVWIQRLYALYMDCALCFKSSIICAAIL